MPMPNEDYFEDTKMSFGEHLEELRVSLFRALVGLVVGFLIGLVAAKHVVRFIQRPLTNALEEHYVLKAEMELKDRYGRDIPEDLRQFIARERLIYEEVYVEREQLERAAALMRRPVEDSDTQGALPPPDQNMIHTRIWRRLSTKITTLSVQESFMIWLKAGFVTGLLLASPYIFYQIWVFVAAGLYPHEKKYVYLYLPFSVILFWSGAAMAFFLAFRYVLRFLLSFNRDMDLYSEPRISEWIGFVLFLPLGFGIAFQLPLVMLFLNRIGIFTIRQYLIKWRIAVLVICVISMLLTPADPISMVLMATPLTALYFFGVALCRWMPRRRNPFNEGFDPV